MSITAVTKSPVRPQLPPNAFRRLGTLLAGAALGLTATATLDAPQAFAQQLAAAPTTTTTSPPAPTGTQDLAPAPAPANLSRIYRGSDGSYVFTHRIGSRVLGMIERAGSHASAFDATVDGSKLKGSFWDVAKGHRTLRGSLSLTIQDAGAKLVRDGGTDFGSTALTAIAPGEVRSWPKARDAGFQSVSPTDLDGAFASPGMKEGRDRAYVRDVDGKVVVLAEHGFDGERPTWAGVFIGTRTSPTTFSGRWAGVPKGHITTGGTFTATQSATDRSFSVSAIHDDGDVFQEDRRYSPDYAVSMNTFAGNLDKAFKGKTVGYAWAVAHGGEIVKRNAGGLRRIKKLGEWDGGDRPFVNDTTNEIASTSKTVTAVAVARALGKRGLTLDAPVGPYLPANWKRGPGMDTVTFRQMLKHAGLKHPGKTLCSKDPFDCLRQSVKAGMVADPGYNNIHYALMRVVLPFIVKGSDMKKAFANPENDRWELNKLFSGVFRSYIVGMLADRDITTDFRTFTENSAYGYVFGSPITGGVAPTGTELTAGSGGMRITATDYAKFLSAFDRGQLVPPSVVADMKADGVGFDGRTKVIRDTPVLGAIQTKNGGTSYVASQLMMFPSDVQVFVTINSAKNATGSLQLALWNAWKDALL